MMRLVLATAGCLALAACEDPGASDTALAGTALAPRVSVPPPPEPDSLLRHVVLFRFDAATTPSELAQIEAAFNGLPAAIPEILDFEWGTNNSPEDLDQGYTHAYLLTFASEADRAAYLPHPAHVAFGEVVGPHVDAVHVVDYWTHGPD